MLGPRLGGLALLAMAACATSAPPVVGPPPSMIEPTPQTAAAPPVMPILVTPEPTLAPPLAPTLARAPRRNWRRIPLGQGARMASAFVASEIVTNPDGTRRVWMVINLLEPIRLPETGGYARSAAYLADFRCEPHAWNPLIGIWYSQPHAVNEVLREPARGPSGIRDVGEGSFVDVFVNAACASPPPRRGR